MFENCDYLQRGSETIGGEDWRGIGAIDGEKSIAVKESEQKKYRICDRYLKAFFHYFCFMRELFYKKGSVLDNINSFESVS